MAPARKDPQHRKSRYLTIRCATVRFEQWQESARTAREHERNEELDFTGWVTRALNQAMSGEAIARELGTKRRARGSAKGGNR